MKHQSNTDKDNKMALDFTDARPASAINPARDPLPIELEEIMVKIEDFFKGCGTMDYLAYKSGATKNANDTFKFTTFIKN